MVHSFYTDGHLERRHVGAYLSCCVERFVLDQVADGKCDAPHRDFAAVRFRNGPQLLHRRPSLNLPRLGGVYRARNHAPDARPRTFLGRFSPPRGARARGMRRHPPTHCLRSFRTLRHYKMRALLLLAFIGHAHGLVGHAYAFVAMPTVSSRSAPVMTPTTDGRLRPGTRAVRLTGAATVGAVRVTGKATRAVAATFARPFRRSTRAAAASMDAERPPALELEEEMPTLDDGSTQFRLETRPDYGEVRMSRIVQPGAATLLLLCARHSLIYSPACPCALSCPVLR